MGAAAAQAEQCGDALLCSMRLRVAAVVALADVWVAASAGVEALAVLLQAPAALAAAAPLVPRSGGDLQAGGQGKGRHANEEWGEGYRGKRATAQRSSLPMQQSPRSRPHARPPPPPAPPPSP